MNAKETAKDKVFQIGLVLITAGLTLMAGGDWRIFVGFGVALIGFSMAVYGVWLHQEVDKKATKLKDPSPPRRFPWWLVPLIVAWCVLGYDIYDRNRAWSPRHFSDNPTFIQVHDKTFTNQIIDLDNHSYTDCTFNNVTFRWNGGGPFAFRHDKFVGRTILSSADNPILATVDFLKHVGVLSDDFEFKVFPKSEPQP